jgi:hypothetical protein
MASPRSSRDWTGFLNAPTGGSSALTGSSSGARLSAGIGNSAREGRIEAAGAGSECLFAEGRMNTQHINAIKAPESSSSLVRSALITKKRATSMPGWLFAYYLKASDM